ncbi:MAG: 50S ribosomal protein L4 [Clostridiales bacterium]|jgi:large subunit ribosomal protein L4|nr:50S ribosomal protein L4 [Clostridiales bacterium]
MADITVKVYSQTGAETGTLTLSESVFGQAYNNALIHQVVVAQQNNKRQGTKSALTRTEVRGGGKKPWRQKHTGRARQGSTRSPQWTGGGVVFAPKPRDFSQKINKKMKTGALLSALSKKLADGELIVLDKLTLAAPKTKEVVKVLASLKLDKSVLLVLGESDATALRAGGNIPTLSVTAAAGINVLELLRHNKVVLTVDAVKKIEEAYAVADEAEEA